MVNKEIQAKVLGGVVIRLTFDGGFQRSKIYKPNRSDVKRKEFRDYLNSELPKILFVIQRRKRYNDSAHYKMFKKFSSSVTSRFAKILYKR